MIPERKAAWHQRLAANLGLLWTDCTLPDAIEAAGRNGFPAVELHYPGTTSAEVVANACRRAGVALLGINLASGIAAIPSARQQFDKQFAELLDWAVIAGARSLHLLAGMPSAEEREMATACLVANVRNAADAAAPFGIGILLEPLNRHDRPGYFYHIPEEAARIIELVGRPNVAMQFDAYHVAREGLDPISEFRRWCMYIGHVQIAGVPARDEPDGGIYDYSAFLSALDTENYDGWIGCEYVPRAKVEDGLGWREVLMQREVNI
jgi:2-dehydrotetronate isomerase